MQAQTVRVQTGNEFSVAESSWLMPIENWHVTGENLSSAVTSFDLLADITESALQSTSKVGPVYQYQMRDLATTDADLNPTQFDVNIYLTNHLGFRHRDVGESVALTVIYGLVFLSGVIGNVMTCAVIVRNAYMHTATNCYLFSLAISDMLVLLLGLPPELYTIWEAYPWRFGETYCLFKTFLTELMSSASILTIMAFTVERYVAICHPLRAHAVSRPSRAVKTIFVIWITASLAALPYPLNTRTYHYLHHPDTDQPLDDSLVCNIPLAWMPKMKYVIQASTGLLFVLPMCVMTALYVSIAIALRRSSAVSSVRRTSAVVNSAPAAAAAAATSDRTRRSAKSTTNVDDDYDDDATVGSTSVDGGGLGNSISELSDRVSDMISTVVLRRPPTATYLVQHGPVRQRQTTTLPVQPTPSSRRAVLRILVAVLVMFFVCWAPFHAQRILTACVPDDGWTATLIEVQSKLFYVSGILYYVSSTVNPILYNLMSYRYRRAFCDTLRCVGRRRLPTSSSAAAAGGNSMASLTTVSQRLSCGAASTIYITSSTSFASNRSRLPLLQADLQLAPPPPHHQLPLLGTETTTQRCTENITSCELQQLQRFDVNHHRQNGG